MFRVPRSKCERLPQPVNADWFSHFLRVRKLCLDDCQSAVVNCFFKVSNWFILTLYNDNFLTADVI